MRASSLLAVKALVTLNLCFGLAPPRPTQEQWMMAGTTDGLAATDETHCFPHVHSDIVSILDCTSSEDDDFTTLVDPETLAIRWSDTPDKPTPVLTQLLVDMAYASDNALYQNLDPLEKEPVLQALATMGDSDDPPAIVAATLVSLNFLEGAIRRSTGFTAGRAPLLKAMVTRLSNARLACILMTLLLPHGLNLRNLLWHGFVASNLPRRWLSLVLILTYHIKQNTSITEKPESSNEYNSWNIMFSEPSVHALLKRKSGSDSDSMKIIMDWLPESHYDLLRLAFAWKDTRPASSLSLLSILLEHGLRLDWCRINDLPEHSIAQPGAYYVTLDGHGQKHQHDLLLHPFIGENEDTENKLITHVGGAVVALLTDLFASSSGGPNLRAALAHGLWDAQLERELLEEKSDKDAGDLLKMANLVVIAMQSVAQSSPLLMRQYKPLFSYRAVTLRNLETVWNQLQRLGSLGESLPTTMVPTMPNDHIATLNVSASFDDVIRRLRCALEISNCQEWRARHVFQELEINTMLAEYGATQSLLNDLGVVTLSFASTLAEAMEELRESNNMDGRSIKRARRVCSVAHVATTVYRFAAFVAMLSLEQALGIHRASDSGDDDGSTLPPDVILKAVERSRMCISTFDNFLFTNTDRSFKAAVEFTKGKTVKAVVLYNLDSAKAQARRSDKK